MRSQCGIPEMFYEDENARDALARAERIRRFVRERLGLNTEHREEQ